jgi:ABC-type proline/glycine betaine transport system permease subunit
VTVEHFMREHRAEILARTPEHLWLVTAAMGIALLIGLPVGVALVGHSSLRRCCVLGGAS